MSSSTFTVTLAADRVRLGEDRHGAVHFTAVNATPRALRGIARAVPIGDTQKEWFTIDGDVMRPFAPGGKQDYDVAIQLPADAQSGEHRVRFDVVGVENPDADYGRSPEVTVLVPGLPSVKTLTKGYLTTALGAAAGGIIAGLVGTLPAALFLISALHQATVTNPNENIAQAFFDALFTSIAAILVAVVLGFIGLLLGIWVGPVLGAFIALRARAQTMVGLTVGLLAALQPLITAGLLALLIVAGNSTKNSGVVIAISAAIVVIDLALPALLARGAARLIRLRKL